MLLAIFIILLVINIIGFLNRKKAWSKILLLSQVFVVIGMAVTFNIYTNKSGIEGIEARKKRDKQNPAQIDDLKNMAKGKKTTIDTVDLEKEKQSTEKVKGF